MLGTSLALCAWQRHTHTHTHTHTCTCSCHSSTRFFSSRVCTWLLLWLQVCSYVVRGQRLDQPSDCPLILYEVSHFLVSGWLLPTPSVFSSRLLVHLCILSANVTASWLFHYAWLCECVRACVCVLKTCLFLILSLRARSREARAPHRAARAREAHERGYSTTTNAQPVKP